MKDSTKKKIEAYKFQAQLKLTPLNLGFLAVMLGLAVLGGTPAYLLAQRFV